MAGLIQRETKRARACKRPRFTPAHRTPGRLPVWRTFAGLRGEALYVANISSGAAENVQSYFQNDYGRLRTVRVGPDGMLYALTNNRDGRGTPDATDDRLIRIDPKQLGL